MANHHEWQGSSALQQEGVQSAQSAVGEIARLTEALSRESAELQRWRAEAAQLRADLGSASIENARLSGLLGREADTSAPGLPPARGKKGG